MPVHSTAKGITLGICITTVRFHTSRLRAHTTGLIQLVKVTQRAGVGSTGLVGVTAITQSTRRSCADKIGHIDLGMVQARGTREQTAFWVDVTTIGGLASRGYTR